MASTDKAPSLSEAVLVCPLPDHDHHLLIGAFMFLHQIANQYVLIQVMPEEADRE